MMNLFIGSSLIFSDIVHPGRGQSGSLTVCLTHSSTAELHNLIETWWISSTMSDRKREVQGAELNCWHCCGKICEMYAEAGV